MLRYFATFFALTFSSSAIEVVVKPDAPTIFDTVEIEIHGCAQPGTLHWGVNAEGWRWQEPLPDYRPAGSEMSGVAVNTPMEGPDENGICRVRLGPFLNAKQPVKSINFALKWRDGTWSNKDEKNYNINVSFGRISWEPKNPTVSDRITVRVLNSPAGGQLRWGVNAENDLWKTPITNYWPKGSALADDRIGVDAPLSRPDRNGVSTAVLGPFNSARQVVRTLHLAAHWGAVWETDVSRNYNLTVGMNKGENAPFVNFLSPSNGEIVVDAPNVVLQAENAEDVDMWLNGRNVATLREAPFELRIPFRPLNYGMHRLTARAERGEEVGMQEIVFWKIPPHVMESIPEGTPWGATENGDGTVTFALHAPGKFFVSVAGDFNGWNPYADMMKYSPDGTWWLTRPVSNGVHKYQYCIEGRNYLADPYARDVSWKDDRGREGYQPKDAMTVLAVGQPAYAWKTANYVRPALDRLAIYEFHINDLCPGQGFTGVIKRLDYIRGLGFTAIEPLPFTEFTLGTSWGYNPSFHFAPETAYGTPDELKMLIDETHRRGMAFIMDVVLNHMDRNSPLNQLYGSDYEASPFFRLFRGDNWGFPDLDQESKATKRYESDLVHFWLKEYRVDGFRYDATRWVEWAGYNDWGASWIAYAARQADPTSIQIAEHLPSDPALINETEMDTGWGDNFHWPIKRMVVNGAVDRGEFERALDPKRIGYTNAAGRVAYTESHDEERVMHELTHAGYGMDEAMRRAVTLMALTLTAPGPAMVYSGQEFGEDTRKIVGPNPLNWMKLKKSGYRRMLEKTGILLRLRETNPALLSDGQQIQWDGLPENVVVYQRTGGQDAVVVAANFGKKKQAVSIPLPAAGAWTDILNGGATRVLPTAGLSATIEAGGVVVLALQPDSQLTLAKP